MRLRPYEISNAEMSTDTTPDNGDDMLRQVGIKIWVDGSPWIGNIDLSFPYLDTDATRTIGVTPGSCGHANYTREQLTEIVEAYFPLGWQMACHVQGDAGVDTILDVYEDVLRKHPRTDHRLRLEHVGAIRHEQLQRAHDLGVTCSIFVDQIHYWGDVIVDGLFGPEHGERWMPCGSAVKTGMRISLHNDPPVTPEEPLRNISVAVTRTAPSGRVLGPEERLDGRSGHPRADHRRGVAAVLPTTWSARWRSASTPTWWCCRPIRVPCRRRRSPISKFGRRSWRVGRFMRKATDAAAAMARSDHV